MQVREGWSTAYGEERFDVTLSEDTGDLELLLAPYGLEPSQLTLSEKYLVLSAEVQRLAIHAKVERGHDSQEARAAALSAAERLKARIQKIRGRLEVAG